MTKDEKLALLKLPLDEKIKRTKELILEWYLQYDGQVFVSFSGRKDSTVLLHIARSIKTCADIPAVFVDTGLEYPELRQHVKNTENVIWVKPKYTFKQVLEKYGYPIISKEQSRYIYDMRHSKSDKLKDVRMNGRLLPNGKRGSMSRLSNCNAFSAKHPESKPMSFWTEQDVLEYIRRFNLEIPSVYGEIKEDENGKLYTTGVHRTGRMFCMYGLHCEKKGETKFDKMKQTHPKQYDYCMNQLGLKTVIDEYLKCSPRKDSK